MTTCCSQIFILFSCVCGEVHLQNETTSSIDGIGGLSIAEPSFSVRSILSALIF